MMSLSPVFLGDKHSPPYHHNMQLQRIFVRGASRNSDVMCPDEIFDEDLSLNSLDQVTAALIETCRNSVTALNEASSNQVTAVTEKLPILQLISISIQYV